MMSPERLPQRPGGVSRSVERPSEQQDGSWANAAGEKFTKDQAYAWEFWDSFWAQGKDIEPHKEAMRESITKAAETIDPSTGEGELGILSGGGAEIDSYSKQKISAYRELAREMGYEVGQLKLNQRSGTITGTIKKLP